MPNVHLCITCYNEAAIIGRFLDSFLPHVDGIHAVLARGASAADDTEEILRSRGVPVSHYKNGEPGAAWPHVDNFAAARQQSWEMGLAAGADWLMWADCDDVITESAEGVLAAIRRGDSVPSPALVGPYITGTDGSHAKRTRLVHREARPRWVNAVHEDIDLAPGTDRAWCPELQILHAPAADKRGSTDRNRRILEAIPEEERSGREWFFLFRECELAGDIVPAMTAAIRATACDDLSVPEKQAAYLTIGRWIKDIDGAEPPLVEALRLDPSRREPLYELARINHRHGRGDRARQWLALMEAIPMPDAPAWNHDASLYGWRAADLAMRIRGDWQETLRRQRKRPGIRISVAHPTCRPDEALRVREMWLERAVRPDTIEYVFGIEPGVAAAGQHEILRTPHAVSQPVPDGHSSAVANYNAAAMACTGPIVIAAQDDIYPPHAWDEQIWRALGPHTARPAALWVHDGHRGDRDQLMVIMCITRQYLRQQGYLLCPEYDGYWSDTEFSWRAVRDGIVIDGRHIKFFHNHPAFTGAPSDEHYMRQQNPEANARGKAIFLRRNPDCSWVS
jgi:hypothetical protein